MHIKASHGFTLVELSIVLVIIGLIVGGVTVGQSLIQSTTRQAVLREVSTIQMAHTTFVSQFNALPGDMADATEYWTSGTKDGDGDGIVALNNFRFGMATEGQNAFIHLNLAEIYPQSDQYPSSRLGDQYGYSYYYVDNGGAMKNTFVLGDRVNKGWRFTNGALTPEQAFTIDKKTDDGFPNTGEIRAVGTPFSWASTYCGTEGPHESNLSATYRVDQTDKNCMLIFMTNDSRDLSN